MQKYDLHTFKKTFDPDFEDFIASATAKARSHTIHKRTHIIIDHIQKLSRNGKRLRPYVCFVASQTSYESIRPLLFAIETLHLFALIHDDIMDKALFRHNIKTIEALSLDLPTETPVDKKNLAQGDAILAGDLVYNWAQEIFYESGAFSHLGSLWHTLIEEVVVGQMLDIGLTSELEHSEQDIETKIILKTARYSLARPMELGALFGQRPTSTLFTLGEKIGIVYQLQDDILDVFGDTETTAKPTLQDFQNNQANTLLWALYQKVPRESLTTYKSPLSPTQAQEIRSLFIQSGALEYTQSRIHELNSECITLCNLLPEQESTTWKSLIALLANRTT